MERMEMIVGFFERMLRDDSFAQFQEQVTREMEASLKQGYDSKANEVNLVKALVDAIKRIGNTYPSVSLHSKMLHGSRSFVKFRYCGGWARTELADSVFITVVTMDGRPVLQRICFVSHKKARDPGKPLRHRWHIDRKQLYLLTNFPEISGEKGVLAGKENVRFMDIGRSLGAYGLFLDPGEMIFLSASVVSEMVRGCRAATPALKEEELTPGCSVRSLPCDPLRRLRCLADGRDLPLRRLCPCLGCSLPFLGNATFIPSLRDLVRNWTLCNIGEYCFACGRALDLTLDALANALVAETGAGDAVDTDHERTDLDLGIAVFVAHVEVGQGYA
jgi:hypothetical protein